MKRRVKKIINIIKEILGFLLLTGGIFIVIFGALNFSAVGNYLSQFIFIEDVLEEEEKIKKIIDESEKKQELFIPSGAKKLIKKEYPVLNVAVAPTDFRIVIPKLGVNAPVLSMDSNSLKVDKWSDFEDLIQGELQKGTVHYPGTAQAGEEGNLFITGHSSYYPWDPGEYKDIFSRLTHLNVGDKYYIFQNQKKFGYKIIEKKVVKPNDVSVLKQEKGKKISTLMTCTPIGTTLNRLIIKSELI